MSHILLTETEFFCWICRLPWISLEAKNHLCQSNLLVEAQMLNKMNNQATNEVLAQIIVDLVDFGVLRKNTTFYITFRRRNITPRSACY